MTVVDYKEEDYISAMLKINLLDLDYLLNIYILSLHDENWKIAESFNVLK